MYNGGEQREENLPANMRPSPNAGLMLAQRLRRWPSINPVLGERLVFVELPTVHHYKRCQADK